MEIAAKLLNLILAHEYQMTEHAIESMDDDGLSMNDVISCLARGKLSRSWPRERKYRIHGRSVDGRRMYVVARLIGHRKVRIITIYEHATGKN